MIIMGAGICQWFHGDATYRAILALLMLTGCMGRNGGGWAHYVGQEKCRPITGWISLANALDWSRPPRTMIGTAYWYMHTDQWRFDGYSRRRAGLAAGRGAPRRHAHRRHDRAVRPAGLDAVLPAVRPQPARPRRRGERRRRRRAARPTPASYVADALHDGSLQLRRSRTSTRRRTGRARWCCGGPTCSGSSAKGNEYFLKHLLGTHSNVLATETAGRPRPRDVAWHDEAPEGKLDLLVCADFRMTSTTLLSDVVLPGRHLVREARPVLHRHASVRARLHPGDRPAVGGAGATSTRSTCSPAALSELAADPPRRPQGPGQRAAAARHPGRDRAARRRGPGLARAATCPPVPGKTMPALQVVERDYTAIADKLAARRPAGRPARLHRQERHLPARARGRRGWPAATA